MIRSKLLALGLAAAGILGASAAMAASTTHQLNVTASVNGTCKFNNAGPTNLAFGAIDPTGTGNATASANVLFRCTKGTTSSLASEVGANDTGGTHRLEHDTTVNADYMVYAVSYAGSDAQVGTGHGSSGDLTLAVSGSIADTQYQNARAGSYTDTLTLTIFP